MNRITIGNLRGRANITLGEGLPTRINCIVGVTNYTGPQDVELETKKIDLAAHHGVDTITDLSMVRLPRPLGRYVKDRYPHLGVGMNPPYLPYVENHGKITPSRLFEEIQTFVLNGGDHMTMNFFPRTRRELEDYTKGRQVPITSRQGGLLALYMRKHHRENPYWEILDDLLPLLREYRVTVNIGSTFRPAGIAEANDRAHSWETDRQLELYRLFDESGVQSLVEAMSHQPFHSIGPGIQEIRQRYGGYVPFQFLGPVVTDIDIGYNDHIAAAIGAAEAARYNVGKVTTIPSREHIGFPSLEDTERGIIAARLAVHAGDLARLPHLMKEDASVLAYRGQHHTCDVMREEAGCNKCAQYCPLILAQAYVVKESLISSSPANLD